MTPTVALKPAYLDKPAVCAFVSVKETTIDELMRKGDFPKPRVLSARRVGWLVRELEAWAESRPVSDLLPPPNTGAKKQPQAQAAQTAA